jgi:uncharacterized protein YqhQ
MFLHSKKPTDISFQYKARNKLTDYIWANIGWIDDDEKLYELLIYTIYALQVSAEQQNQDMQNSSDKNVPKKKSSFTQIMKRTIISFCWSIFSIFGRCTEPTSNSLI